MTSSVAALNGGISSGLQVYDEHLVLDGLGNTTFAQTITLPNVNTHTPFTLSFTFGGITGTTGTLFFDDPSLAADIATAFNAVSFPSIGHLGWSPPSPWPERSM